jgi:hypothetical protein
MSQRRIAVLIAMAALLIANASPFAISQNAGAQIILNMESSKTVDASNISQIVLLHGNVTVAKPPKVIVTVYLFSTTDVGWNTQCGPDQFEFQDSDVREFTCSMTLPAKTMNITGTVTVTAILSGHGLSDSVYLNATITVQGSVPVNGTIGPAPPTWGLNSPLEKAVGLTLPAIALVATILIAAAAVAAFLVRRRKTRSAAPPPQ